MEQTIAELKSAGLAHLPSGEFGANAAWLALAAMTHNLGRGVGILAGGDLARDTAANLRRRLFTIHRPARAHCPGVEGVRPGQPAVVAGAAAALTRIAAISRHP